MLQLVLSTALVICGCIWNGFELEKVVSHPAGGRQFGLGLTFVQCVVLSVLAFAHCAVLRLWELLTAYCYERRRSGAKTKAKTKTKSVSRSVSRDDAAAVGAFSRPLITLGLGQALWVALLFWLTNSINNAVFRFGVAVPIQQLVRSCSLLSSAASGYVMDGKRFSAWQVLHLVVICGGIAALSILGTSSPSTASCGSAGGGCEDAFANNSINSSSSSSSYQLFPDARDPSAVFLWLCGVALLVLSAFLATFLGMAQTNMYKIAEARGPAGVTQQPGVTEEAIFTSHFISVSFFAAYYALESLVGSGAAAAGSGGANPVTTFMKMPRDLQTHIAFNCLSQYVCIWGVFALARTSGAFYLTMVTTVRKFVSLLLSIVYFGHSGSMSAGQLAAIAAVTCSVTVYPFLQSPPPMKPAEANEQPTNPTASKSKSKKKRKD
jgi:UDP-xylose/UDP-N-acetylglucosamine transporter B4